MATEVNKYRLFCIDEDEWVHKWVQIGETLVMSCPNDTSHVIRENSSRIVDTLKTNEILIQEELIKTQGNFRSEGFEISTTSAPVTIEFIQFKYPVNLTGVYIDIAPYNMSDHFTAHVEPPYKSTLQSETVIGTFVIPIDYVVLNNFADIGFVVYIQSADGLVEENLGEILSIDKTNSTVTVEHPTTISFAAGSKIQIAVVGVKNIYLSAGGVFEIGQSKIGGSYVPLGAKIRVTYTNSNQTVKKCTFKLEYLY
jgi:hypothetical protein